MRKILLLISLILIAVYGYSQSVFHENFEPPSGADSVVSSGIPGWTINSTLASEGVQSYHSGIAVNESSSFTTNKFSTTNSFTVFLSFAQIAKVSPFDAAIIEVSIDSMFWLQMTSAFVTYLGAGDFSLDKFTAASYADWDAANDATIPDNTWWKTELFDISAIAADQPEFWFRFTVYDDDGNGSAGNYGWLVDDIRVDTSSCELIPPTVIYNPPIIQGSTTNPGPYLVSADIFDFSGILSANLVYTLNGVAQSPIPMVNTSASTYEASIPGAVSGDVICYQIEATDNCNNVTTEPGTPYCFTIAVSTVPPVVFIGTGSVTNTSTTYPAPYGNWYWGARHQMLILASEMQAAGVTQPTDLLSLAFDVVAPGGQPLNNFEILIGHTTQSDMNSWVPQAQLTSVFFTAIYSETTGWNVHNFSSPFAWNGSDNIVVETCFNNISYISNAVHNQSITPFVSTRWNNADISGVCNDLTSVSSTASQRPNMRFQTPPKPLDAGVVSIIQPVYVVPAGQSIPLEVLVANIGINEFNNFDISYTIDGVFSGSINVTDTLLPNDTLSFILPNFTAPIGDFTICAYVQLTGDGYLGNDTICKDFFGVPVYNLSYTTNFDGPVNDWYAQPTTGATVWELGTPAFGITNSAHSAPNAWDINLSSAYTANATAYLYSPIFDIVNGINASLSFWQNRNTQLDQDGFRLEYTLNGGNTWITLGNVNSIDSENWYDTPNMTISGQAAWTGSSGGWVRSQYLLNSTFNNQQVQFRFVFNSDGFTQLDGVSIDDFSLTEAFAVDLGVKRIISPNVHPAGTSVPATVVVKNYGMNTINSFDITYDIGSGPVLPPTTWSTPLAPGDSVTVSLGNLITPSGNYNFCAFITLATDLNSTNDTLCKVATGVPTINVTFATPYFDDFDGTNPGWTATTGSVTTTVWELGTPSYGTTNSAYSPPNAWDVNLNTAYQPNASAYLTSPYFNFSNAVSAVLSFYQNRNTQTNFDGTRLEYSINNGPWQILGTTSTGTNWYNSSVAALGSSGWSGSTNGWIKSSIDLPADFNNQSLVQFRFFFASNASTQWDGFSIDDFEINVPPALSVSAQNLDILNNLLIPGTPQIVTVQIRNHGTTALQNVKVSLEVDGTHIVTDNLSFSPPLSGHPTTFVYNHTFSQQWIATTGTHTVTAYTTDPNGGTDQNLSDDTVSIVVTVLNLAGPHCDDFEGGQQQWLSLNAYSYSASTNWELGTPGQTFINSAFNGNNSWMIKLNTNYGPRDSSALFTPIFNLSAGQCYKISFQHIFATELYHDGGTFEYTIDGTLNWNSIGSHIQPNWYNMQYIASLGNNPPRPGWSGQSNGWQLAENYIGFTTDRTIMFRFRFASDMSNHDEGWAIDEFCFEEDLTGQCVLLTDMDLIASPSGLVLDQNYPNPADNSTVISYIIPERGDVSLVINNMLGQQVKVLQTGIQQAGPHSVEVDLNELSAGIYYYTLTFNNEEQMVKKMVVTK
jgi:hypothetical protein